MLGIGGSLQSQWSHPLHADRHKENVHRLYDGGPSSNAKDGQTDGGGASSSSSSSKKRKRKLDEREMLQQDVRLEKRRIACEAKPWIPLHEVLIAAKEKMSGPEKANGITFAFMGSSGCGKSTVIRKVFIEKIFGKKATKERDDREYIIEIFTNSAKSDAFNDLPKEVLVDPKGLDEDNINFCYHMNENYDKKYNFFIMMDDCLDIRYRSLVERMFLTMRNTNISSLVSLQYPKLIPPSIRTSVYFALFFFFNNDEAVEQAVRGWLSSYLPGNSIREKVFQYRKWIMGSDGHNMFLMDNLNHRCYKIDASSEEYLCHELYLLCGDTKLKGEKDEVSDEEEEGGVDILDDSSRMNYTQSQTPIGEKEE